MALTIGFATEFYTLWDVSAEGVYSSFNGQHTKTGEKTIYSYLKNISKDLDKTMKAYPGLTVDEDLKGKTRSFEKFERIDHYSQFQFSFGKLEGREILESTDIWQLERAMKEERGARRRVNARRRLITLGALVRYRHDHYVGSPDQNWGKRDPDGNLLPPNLVEKFVVRNYASPSFVKAENEAKEREKQKTGHFFQDGAKVEITLREIKSGSFPGFRNRRTYIKTYIDESYQVYKYLGSSPIQLQEGWNKVRATINHTHYQDFPETRLIRMKLLQNVAV